MSNHFFLAGLQKFSDGVEHVDLFKFKEGTSAYEIEEIMNLATDLPNKMKTSFGEFTSGDVDSQNVK